MQTLLNNIKQSLTPANFSITKPTVISLSKTASLEVKLNVSIFLTLQQNYLELEDLDKTLRLTFFRLL